MTTENNAAPGGLTIPRELLQNLIDDADDYATSRKCMARRAEIEYREQYIAEARALLAAAPKAAEQAGQEPVARVQSYVSDRPYSKGERVKEAVFLSDVRDDTLLYAAPIPRASDAAALSDADCRERIARALHYPACWDTAAYPTLESAAWEAIAAAKLGCGSCDTAQPDERAAFDTKACAESLTHMIVEWVEGGIRTGQNWRGMSGVIEKRINRFVARATAPQATKGDSIFWAKRIMVLVDKYEQAPSMATRADLRAEVMDALLANAAAPQAEQRMSDAEDAARYRYLRSRPMSVEPDRIDVVYWSALDESANEGEALRGDGLDAAIDAARTQEKQS